MTSSRRKKRSRTRKTRRRLKRAAKEEKKPEKEAPEIAVKVDFDNLEARVVILPPKAGNFGGLAAFEGKLVYSEVSEHRVRRRIGVPDLL
jgi:tricorn protease